jgi:long-subunit fatty acid transport protein
MRLGGALGTAALAIAALDGSAYAQTKTGTSMGQFLLIEPSARVTAMGNAGVALAAGLDGVFYNPAAIAGATRHAVTFTHAVWLADIRYEYAAGAMPVGAWGNLFASVTSLNSGEIDVRTVTQPLGTGERYSVSDVALALGYGRQITDRFSAGAQVTYAQETIWHSTASMMTVSAGMAYRVSERGLHIGASLAHFGTQAGYDGRDLRITYDQDPDRFGDNSALPAEIFTGDFPVPVFFRLGAGMPFRFGDDLGVRVELDASHPSDNTESVSLGTEFLFRERLAVRFGYQNAFLQDSEVGLTAGTGVQGILEGIRYQVDYAWADHGRLGSTQRLTIGFAF